MPQRFPKSPLEKQVLGDTLGDGILTSRRRELALAETHGGATVPSR